MTEPASPGALIRRLSTGVPGLDAVLGGGIPEFSFNLLAGGPGAGKTTLAQQILFANATPARPGLYFTVLGEPTLKMIRYQRQFRFFEPGRVGTDIHLVNLSAEATAGDLDAVLARVIAEIDRLRPGVVAVDSFRTLGRRRSGGDAGAVDGLERFVQQLRSRTATLSYASSRCSRCGVRGSCPGFTPSVSLTTASRSFREFRSSSPSDGRPSACDCRPASRDSMRC